MAGLDTSIALGIKPVDFGDPNEGRMNALRAQMMQMQMQQGQFNMMKAQRDMEYQNQQRAAAAAAVARDKAAEKEAINAFLKTAQPGSAFNPNPNTPYAPDDASAEGSGMFPGWNNAQPPDMNATIQQLRDRGRFDAARKMMGQNQAFNVNESSNVKLDEEKNKSKQVDFETKTKAMALHASQLPMVTQQSYASWREATLRDLPHLKDQLPEQAPADPQQFELLKRQLAAKASDVLAQNYQTITTGNQTQTVNINPITQLATPVPGTEGTTKPDKESDVATLIRERNSLNKNSPTYAQDLEIYNDRIEKATNIKGGGNELPPLKPADKFKIEQGLNKSYSTATSLLDTLEDAHDAIQNVQGSDLAGATGIPGRLFSLPNSTAATAESRMKTLEGKVTALGKASAASTGAIGTIATQEWKILRDMVTSLDPNAGDKVYRAALDNVEAQLQGAKNRIRDAYEKAHVDTLKRPEFQQYGALPEPRERGGVMPGSYPTAQKPAVNRVQPNPPAGGAPYAPGTRAPAGGNPYASKSDAEIKAALGIKD